MSALPEMAGKLTQGSGNNYSAQRLSDYCQLYIGFKDFPIWHSRVPNLTRTYIRRIMAVSDPEAKPWYVNEAAKGNVECTNT